jgi:hypothetical protein
VVSALSVTVHEVSVADAQAAPHVVGASEVSVTVEPLGSLHEQFASAA